MVVVCLPFRPLLILPEEKKQKVRIKVLAQRERDNLVSSWFFRADPILVSPYHGGNMDMLPSSTRYDVRKSRGKIASTHRIR